MKRDDSVSAAEYRELVRPGGGDPKRLAKYRNEKVAMPGGRTVDSKREAAREADLELLERNGEISELRRQVTFSLHVNGLPICDYRADFTYRDRAGALVVEDAKGIRTDVYKLKKKLMFAVHGIAIVEV